MSDALFIAVELEAAAAADPALAAKLEEVCPVDIFAQKDDGTLDLVEKNLDECVLCRLCLDATEPGGRMEAALAEWVTSNNSRLPIVAFMAGRFMDEMPGMSFGHAGTIVEGKEDTATEKIARLAQAGIVVAEEISQIPRIVKERLGARV